MDVKAAYLPTSVNIWKCGECVKNGAFSITERLWDTAAIWQWEGQEPCSTWDNSTKGRVVWPQCQLHVC